MELLSVWTTTWEGWVSGDGSMTWRDDQCATVCMCRWGRCLYHSGVVALVFQRLELLRIFSVVIPTYYCCKLFEEAVVVVVLWSCWWGRSPTISVLQGRSLSSMTSSSMPIYCVVRFDAQKSCFLPRWLPLRSVLHHRYHYHVPTQSACSELNAAIVDLGPVLGEECALHCRRSLCVCVFVYCNTMVEMPLRIFLLTINSWCFLSAPVLLKHIVCTVVSREREEESEGDSFFRSTKETVLL